MIPADAAEQLVMALFSETARDHRQTSPHAALDVFRKIIDSWGSVPATAPAEDTRTSRQKMYDYFMPPESAPVVPVGDGEEQPKLRAAGEDEPDYPKRCPTHDVITDGVDWEGDNLGNARWTMVMYRCGCSLTPDGLRDYDGNNSAPPVAPEWKVGDHCAVIGEVTEVDTESVQVRISAPGLKPFTRWYDLADLRPAVPAGTGEDETEGDIQ